MAQIATITKYDIPVFEASDVSPPRIGVDVGGQTGYLNLGPYPDRDVPCIACNINGDLYATKNSIHKIIDDWEDNDNNEYYIPSSSGGETTNTSSSLVAGSTYGLFCNGPVQLFSQPGDGLPYYPRRGDQFEFYVEATDFRDTPAFWRMNFASQGYNTDNLYRVEMESEPTAGSDISFEKRSGGSNAIIRATGDENGANLNTTYRVVVDWGHDEMTLRVYEPDGTLASSNLPLSFVDGAYDGGGISWEANGYMACRFDRCRTLPE